MNSAIYQGTVRHRRLQPEPHAFRYGLFMMYLDLDELDHVFDGIWCWSSRRPALAWFHRADYLGDARVPLDRAVRDLVEQRHGVRPTGPIRMLTHLRYFGYVMNPVTIYYCFDSKDVHIETIVAEVTNTPWNERHAYVLGSGDNRGSASHREYHITKTFHVSPFFDMDHQYRWQFTAPNRRIVVHMENYSSEGKLFDATLVLRRTEITRRSMTRVLAQFPLMTVKVIGAIYWQAARLWLKGTPFYAHPVKRSV